MAYAPFIILGTIEAASIPVVGFNAVLMSEHFGSFLAFGVLHAALGMQYIKVGCCACCILACVGMFLRAAHVHVAGLFLFDATLHGFAPCSWLVAR